MLRRHFDGSHSTFEIANVAAELAQPRRVRTDDPFELVQAIARPVDLDT